MLIFGLLNIRIVMNIVILLLGMMRILFGFGLILYFFFRF